MATEAGLGMKTTFGASAFHNASANEDAFIVKKLREAGMMVLGKANLDVSVVTYVFPCAYHHQELNGFKLRFAIFQVVLADLTQRRSSIYQQDGRQLGARPCHHTMARSDSFRIS